MHHVIAERLDRDSVARARARLARWDGAGRIHPHYAEAWRRWLDLPLDELRGRLRDPDEGARAMRSVSPFAGELPPRERWRILRSVRERLEAS